MILTGGLRRRLIKDNFYYMMNDSLAQLGWFDVPNELAEYGVELLPKQIDAMQEITPNKISIASEALDSEELELGSNLEEYRWDIYLDLFVEDESVGIHLSGDIYDILKGKMSSIGRGRPSFPVRDLTTETEDILFYCDIQNVHANRVREWNRPQERYWWVVGCDLVDSYYGE